MQEASKNAATTNSDIGRMGIFSDVSLKRNAVTLNQLQYSQAKGTEVKMADGLYSLGQGLHWSPTSAPRGQFVAIQDRVETSGIFLVQHFLALFLKAGHRVCFLNFVHSKEHYSATGRKLGVNVATSYEKQKLRWIDCFQEANSSPSASLHELFLLIRQEAASTMEDEPVSIIFDDITALKWRFGLQKTTHFLRSCRALTHELHGRANVVVLTHADADPSSHVGTSSSQILSLFYNEQTPVINEIATVVLSVAPLPSGYFKDVHGTISTQRQCQGSDGIFEKATISYKIMENTIKTFSSGGDALRSL